ncbi:MAG: GTP cyclohydrolase I [Nocardioidaceae bacterium]
MTAVLSHAHAPSSDPAQQPDCPPRRGPAAAALHLVTGQPAVDLPAARTAVRDLLTALGQDPLSQHLRDTPRRVAGAFAELLTPIPYAFTTFPNDEAYDGLVLVRDIGFTSLCEHHLLPFSGVAHIGYLPDEQIVGLSKISRTVRHVRAPAPGPRATHPADRRLAARSAAATRPRRRARG